MALAGPATLSGELVRDTVVFSIADAEWPAVRAGLRFRLARAAPPARS